MVVDPMMQLNEAITSLLETFAYLSIVALAVTLVALASTELRSRIRELKSNAGDRAGRRRGERVAPATR